MNNIFRAKKRNMSRRIWSIDAAVLQRAFLYAGGVTAISRWLSAAIPPVRDRIRPTTPAGVAASGRIGETPRGFHLFELALSSRDELLDMLAKAGIEYDPRYFE